MQTATGRVVNKTTSMQGSACRVVNTLRLALLTAFTVLSLGLSGSVLAATYTSVADGNWNSSGTWQGGNIPPLDDIGANDTVNIHHTVTRVIEDNIKNFGTVSITPLPGTTAELIVPDGVNMENEGYWEVIGGALTQYRFAGGGNTGSAQGGNFKNKGGEVYIEGSVVEVAQDWTNEDGATRTFINSCLLTGQNFSNSKSVDILRGANVSIGWHGSGSFFYQLSSFEFANTQIQLAGTSGSFELAEGDAFGDISYITLKNHVTNTIGGGSIIAKSAVTTPSPLTLDAYCTNDYDNEGIFTGAQFNDLPGCPKTDDYFPCTVDPSSPSLSVTKDAVDVGGDGTGDGPAEVDDVITYDIVVTNTGNISLTNVTVDDDLTGTVDALCAASLAVAASCTVQVQYTVTQADIDNNGGGDGDIDNIGTGDSDETLPESDPESVPLVAQAPALSVAKDAIDVGGDGTGNGPADVDDVITYDIVVTNTGNITLTNVVVDDNLTGTSGAACAATLAVGASCTVQVQYTVTQADLDNNGGGDGDIDNIGTGDSDQTPPDTDPESVPLVSQGPALSVAKDAVDVDGDGTGNGPADVGDVITYDIVVTNTGNITLTNVTVDDNLTGTVDAPCAATLAIGASCTVQVQYAVTQADLDNNGGGDGDIDNIGTGDSDETPPDTDPESVPLVTPNPVIFIDKTASPTQFNAVGATIDYTFDVQNTGNQTLSNVGVTDTLTGFGLSAITCNWAGSSDPNTPAGVLSPNETVQCSASLTTTQEHLNDGQIDNTATATGSSPGNTDDVTDSDDATVTANTNPSLALVKTGTGPDNDYDAPGDVLNYSYLVTNDGNVSLAGPVTIDDDTSSDETCPALPPESGFPAGKLDPGESTTCTATHTVQSGDMDAGFVTNTAQASADGVDSNFDQATLYSDFNPTPDIRIVKTAAPTSFSSVGTTITYTFDVRNTGNVTLTSVDVTDTLTGFGLSPIVCDWAGSSDGNTPPGTLSPDETVQCSATLTTTQAHLDAGRIDNTATATGVPDSCGDVQPPCPPVEDTDNATVTAQQNPGIDIDKTASPGTFSDAGEVITYTFSLQNIGNVTLFDVKVTDPLVGLSAISCNWAADSSDPATGDGILSPGETMSCTATLTTNAGHVAAGKIENLATVTGRPPLCDQGDPACLEEDDDDETVFLVGINLSKSATPAVDNGDGTFDVTYTISVENQGEASATYNLADQLFPGEALTPISIPGPLTYVPGSENAQDGAVKNPILISDFIAGNTLVVGEPLAGGLTEHWRFTIRFELDPSKLTVENADCKVEGNNNYTGFNNLASGTDEKDLTDNWACVELITILLEAAPFCDNDVPWAHYSVKVFGIPGVQPGDITYSWVNTEDNPPNEILVAGPFAMTAFEDDVLWAEATADGTEPGANGLTWPGWVQGPAGVWTEVPTLATPNIDFVVSVNPTASVTLVYPPAAPHCDPSPPDSMHVKKSEVLRTDHDDDTVTVTYRIDVSNTGGQSGTYDLKDKLDADPAVKPVNPAAPVPINYLAGSENDQSGALGTPVAGDFLTGTTLVTGEKLGAGKTEAFEFTLDLAIEQDLLPKGGSKCFPDGTGFKGGLGNDVELLQDNQVVDEDEVCSDIEKKEYPRTTFKVTKTFNDGNPSQVVVRLNCNTGVRLDQEKAISENSPVVFVIKDFEPGELDCKVEEVVGVDGYTTTFDADVIDGEAGDIREDDVACYYDDVVGGEFICELTNVVDTVDVDVHKVWEFINDEGNSIPKITTITVWCNAEISGGTQDSSSGHYYQVFSNLRGDRTVTSQVWPAYPSSKCWATEVGQAPEVDVFNECGTTLASAAMTVSAGKGDECTITNTIFFDGIPTLNRYGMMVLLLLMLGIGAIGVRRFT
jgi:uncharacterized repeat protein (TIGR01451 family)